MRCLQAIQTEAFAVGTAELEVEDDRYQECPNGHAWQLVPIGTCADDRSC